MSPRLTRPPNCCAYASPNVLRLGEAWNENPISFIWTKTAEKILEPIGRLLKRTARRRTLGMSRNQALEPSAPAPAFRLREGGLHHLREGGLGSWTAFEEVRLLNGLERNNQPLASVVLHVRVRRTTGVSFFAGHSGLTFQIEVGALHGLGIRTIVSANC